MTVIDTNERPGLSRRRLFGVAALAVGAATAIALPAQAQTKLAQKTANYQPTPRGKAQCDGCVQWQAPAACKIVSGVIAPAGWCTLYAPKPKS
jgi:hypothetical protein